MITKTIPFICCLFVSFLPGCERPDHHHEVIGDLQSIGSAMGFYEAQSGIPLEKSGITNSAILYSKLVSNEWQMRMIEKSPQWDKARNFIDPWGNDYQWKIQTKVQKGKQIRKLTVFSCGKNRRPDNGTNDDIALSFDLAPSISP